MEEVLKKSSEDLKVTVHYRPRLYIDASRLEDLATIYDAMHVLLVSAS
jgi:hypothetical protein